MYLNTFSHPPTDSIASRRTNTLPIHGTVPPSCKNMVSNSGGATSVSGGTPKLLHTKSLLESSKSPDQLYQYSVAAYSIPAPGCACNNATWSSSFRGK